MPAHDVPAEDSPEFRLALLHMEEALNDMKYDTIIGDTIEASLLGLTGDEAIRGAESVLEGLLVKRDAAFLALESQAPAAEGEVSEENLRDLLRFHEYSGAVTVVKTLIRLFKARNGDL